MCEAALRREAVIINPEYAWEYLIYACKYFGAITEGDQFGAGRERVLEHVGEIGYITT